MRGIIILMVAFLGFPFNSGAQSLAGTSSMRGYYVGSCSSWALLQTHNGQLGWGCSIMPSTVVVPDGYDVGDALKAANDKISDLEKRLSALEAKSGKP